MRVDLQRLHYMRVGRVIHTCLKVQFVVGWARAIRCEYVLFATELLRDRVVHFRTRAG